MRVLVIDDDDALREVLCAALEDIGHDVLAAENGQQAWQLLGENHVQLVITDWVMPTVDGLELVQRIRDGSFPRYIYIIILTARNSQSDIVVGLQSGADDYLTKPFDLHELQARVAIGERLLRSEARQRRAVRRLK
ncbi:MAG: response regulator transcription factor, partial [Ardenticatenaceae bacterium]